jgi:hypothetical protein
MISKLHFQSIDGSLNLFEQESFSFSRFLPGFLLPGQIEYARRTDSFVTVSSSHQLESYKSVVRSQWHYVENMFYAGSVLRNLL